MYSRIDIDYTIEGHINSQFVRGVGKGLINRSTGVNELEVEFQEIADSWDPRTIVLMCCDRVTFMGSRGVAGGVGLLEASGGYASIGRHIVNDFRQAKMVDSDNRVLVDVRASSLTDLRKDRPSDESRIEGGVSHLVPGRNGVRAIRSVSGIMQPISPQMTTLATRYEVELEDDTTAIGHTYYPHFLPEPQIALPGPQIWRMEQIDQEFDGRRLRVQTVTSVAPLSETHGAPETEKITGALNVPKVELR